MNLGGRQSREERMRRSPADGEVLMSGSEAINLIFVIKDIYHLSKKFEGYPHWSIHAYAGIPLCLANLQCLAIEMETYYHGVTLPKEVADILIKTNSVLEFLKYYSAKSDLIEKCLWLYEIRHEILHPSTRQPQSPDKCPDYIRPLKQKGLFYSTGNPNSDWSFFGQLASHKLFTWACHTTKEIAEFIILKRIHPNSGDIMRGIFRDRIEQYFEIGFKDDLHLIESSTQGQE